MFSAKTYSLASASFAAAMLVLGTSPGYSATNDRIVLAQQAEPLWEQQGARRALEKLMTHPGLRQRIARTLEPLFHDDGDWAKLAGVLRVQREALPDGHAAPGLWQALVHLPVRRWQVRHECRRELKLRILALGRSEGFSRGKTRRALEESRRLVGDELMTIQRIAQFSAWERLFSWWHVAHVPFVYLMLLSAVAHVVAVHAY